MKTIIRVAIGTGLLLLIPLVAMQFTEEVDWDLTDFIVMGVLLFVTGLMFNFAMSLNPRYRLIVGVVVIFIFLLIWGELAVGIFGTPFSGS